MRQITTRKALLVAAELEKRIEKYGMSGVRIFSGKGVRQKPINKNQEDKKI